MKKALFLRLSALPALAFATGAARAADNGITTMLAAVDLAGVSTAVGAICLVVVGIALIFKGPDIAKRVIRKV